MIPATWILDGPVMKDAGDIGGDHQIGPAIEARFRTDFCPGARFEVAVYATAKTYSEAEEDDPVCPHRPVILERHGDSTALFAPMPPEHLACSFKPGTVDLQAQFTYRRNGRVENGIYESDDSDHITYEWVGSDIGYDRGGRLPITEEAKYATADGIAYVQNWAVHINQWLTWDGMAEVKD